MMILTNISIRLAGERIVELYFSGEKLIVFCLINTLGKLSYTKIMMYVMNGQKQNEWYC